MYLTMQKGVAKHIVELVIAVLVMGLIIAMIYFSSSGARGELSLQTCKSIMQSQCTSCISGSYGSKCAIYSSGFLSCGCNECDLSYTSELEETRLPQILESCVKALKEIGIVFTDENSAIFNTFECNKIGVSYIVHCPERCDQAPNSNPNNC